MKHSSSSLDVISAILDLQAAALFEQETDLISQFLAYQPDDHR